MDFVPAKAKVGGGSSVAPHNGAIPATFATDNLASVLRVALTPRRVGIMSIGPFRPELIVFPLNKNLCIMALSSRFTRGFDRHFYRCFLGRIWAVMLSIVFYFPFVLMDHNKILRSRHSLLPSTA